MIVGCFIGKFFFCQVLTTVFWADQKKKKNKTVEAENKEWAEKYGVEQAKVIRETVDANIPDYEHLKSFALRV